MKKIVIVWSLAVLVVLSACSDWIDISPKTDVKTEDLFTSEEGFKSALIGIYGRMTGTETYGAKLTFQFIEQLAQRYDNYSSTPPSEKDRAKIYDYKNQNEPKSALSTIWVNMYKNIANINNLLANLETNGFYIETKGYQDLIKGEALGLRAFHYFDLLRMWGPVYSNDSTALAIPYRNEFTSDKVPLMAANEVAHRILDDLIQADSLMKNDPMNYKYNYAEPFIGQRGYKMNKYAVKALLARVYLYIGYKSEAAKYAKEVIDGCGLKLLKDNQKDVSMKDETIFGLSMYEMEEKLNSYWVSVTPFNEQLWISDENRNTVFESATYGINDIRYKNGFGFIHSNNQNMCRKYLGSDVYYKENIPLIRLAEMYYILAESVTLAESVEYINIVRNTRGISRKYNFQYSNDFTDKERRDALGKEIQKEFFAEGQYFYFLKRHNYQTFYRCPVEKMEYYVFPIPDDEIEFGMVSDE